MTELSDALEPVVVRLDRIARELVTIRELTSRYVNAQEAAEKEIPEWVRRYVTYMHDIHDITYMYEQRGLPIPDWILREMERCDDRFRQILKEMHDLAKDGRFEKIRREMAKDEENRWDHTRLLYSPKPKENGQ